MDMSGIWALVQDIGGDADATDWRTGLPDDSRRRIVNKITESLKRHLPFSGQDGLQEIKKIAIRFEEKTFASATSQSDYLRTISSEMLTVETNGNTIQCNAVGNTSQNTHDPVS